MVQEQTNGLAPWRRTGQQHQSNLPVIKLNAIAGGQVESSLQAAGTMTQITGVAFVAVQNRYAKALNVRQGLVAFQMLVDEVNPLSESRRIEPRLDASDGVGTATGQTQPSLPTAGGRDQFPGVETGHPRPEQHDYGFHYRRGGDAGSRPAIRERRDDVPGEGKDLFRIRDQASENGLSFPFPKTIPFQLGDLFDELLHLLVTGHGLADPLLPGLRDTDLARSSPVTLH
jgi:hypothetical protein